MFRAVRHAANLTGNTDPNGPPMGPNITPGGYQVTDEMPWVF